MSTAIIIVIIVVAIGVMAFSVVLLRRSEDDPLLARIDEFAAREEIVSIEEIELSMPITDRIFVPIARRISEFLIRMTPQTTLERTTRLLELAGNPRNLSAANFMLVRAGMAILIGFVTFSFMGSFGDGQLNRRLLYTLGATGLGYFLPIMLLRSMG